MSKLAELHAEEHGIVNSATYECYKYNRISFPDKSIFEWEMIFGDKVFWMEQQFLEEE